MKHTKDVTITLTVTLCPDERRAINYSFLRRLYAVPQDEAALEATAAPRATCKRWLSDAIGHAVEFQLMQYLGERQKARAEAEAQEREES